MRILVTGSRDWKDESVIHRVLMEALSKFPGATLVSGACPTGADSIAEMIWGLCFGAPVERHPADWVGPCRAACKPGHRRRNNFGGTYCPAAGNYRNQDMVDLGADIVLAFQLNGSRGTQDCIDRAKAAGLTVWEAP